MNSINLSNWFEVTVPSSKYPEVATYVGHAVSAAGGATVTYASGSYVRQDTGALETEPVTVYRFDFPEFKYHTVFSAVESLVEALLLTGEESVLLRQYIRSTGYRSLLMTE